MKSHPNFFENIKEASMRLRATIVLYDGSPYHVLAICDNNKDGIFRVYLQPLDLQEQEDADKSMPSIGNFSAEQSAQLGEYLDEWLKAHPNSPIIRKMANSPHFNRFRPFPLGMMNYEGDTYFLSRQPLRNREQGLTNAMVVDTLISVGERAEKRASAGYAMPPGVRLGQCTVNLYSKAFVDCVKGAHPSPQECIDNLKDATIANSAAAFNREFAFVHGPIGMLFLAYRTDIIGVLPSGDLSSLRLGKEFAHAREAVEDLRVFSTITVQQ